jgi:hypothetical protein
MEIEVKKAVQIFFSNASFEMIYLEAFANALDADADEFKIEICANSTNPADLNSLIIKLWDNGIGFDEYRFSKFSKLLSVEDKTHKGLGRLVYLCYFDNVKIESNFSSSERHCSRLHFGGRKKITFWVGKEGATIVSMKGYVNDEPGYETMELMEDSVLYVLERKKLKRIIFGRLAYCQLGTALCGDGIACHRGTADFHIVRHCFRTVQRVVRERTRFVATVTVGKHCYLFRHNTGKS